VLIPALHFTITIISMNRNVTAIILIVFLVVSFISASGLGVFEKEEFHFRLPAKVGLNGNKIVSDNTAKAEKITKEKDGESATKPASADSYANLSLPFLEAETATPWADSVFNELSSKERIAQLFMVAAYSDRDVAHKQELVSLIKNEKIGGLIFFQGDPSSQLKLTKEYQSLTETPLWLGMDIEWGLSMRLSESIKYPYQMTLGAMNDDSLVYDMGAQIATQMKRMGVHVSFSPVLDVNNNPNNPVINYRSFGENRENVSEKGLMYIKGLQENGVLACAKHFPGHGDTDMDSHLALPTVYHDRNRLDSIELFPFKKAIAEGVGSVMVAHLHIPVLDNRENRATTLSSAAVNTLLKKQLKFNGLSFTDALNMKGVSQYYKPGEVDLEALKAGNDVLLFPENVPQAIKMIEKAISAGDISQAEIDMRCLKILKTKEWLGLDKTEELKPESLVEDLNIEEFNWLNQKLADASVTLLCNKENTLPLKEIKDKTISVINIGSTKNATDFNGRLKKFIGADYYRLSKSAGFSEIKTVAEKCKESEYVIVNILDTSNKPKKDFGINANVNLILNSLGKQSGMVLNIFTNAYSLYKLEGLDKFDAVLLNYQDTPEARKSAVDAIMGAIEVNGKLPVSAGSYLEGEGLELNGTIRIRFNVSPLELGINPDDFNRVDKIALKGIKEKAYPGCRVLAIKDEKVILDKSYGYQTYQKKKAINPETVYDLASITKVAATTISLMKLTDEDKFSPYNNICDYLPEVADTSAYFNMNLLKMLSHTAGLKPWIPFYNYTLTNKKPSQKYYKNFPQPGYFKVADKLYINSNYTDSIFTKILKNPLRDKTNYRYSDLGYYLIYRMFPNMSGMALDHYARSNFYEPLGLQTIGYNPLGRLKKSNIAPTENDRTFRGQVIRGYVHDPGAAMLGGVCGHAGLFSNAYDIATLMQLCLNKGTYGGQFYFSASTFDFYNTTHFSSDRNRRGVGFDKPVMEPDKGPACNSASANSFGHSGFTGTLVWADPEEDLVYVFLSNRVYPDAGNRKLLNMNIRTDIQQVIYDAVSSANSENT